MTGTAILWLEDVRATRWRVEVRQRLYDRFDHWLNPLEDRMQKRTPSSESLTQAVLARRQELTQAGTGGMVAQAQRAMLEPLTAACPAYGQTLLARDPQDRSVETLVRAIRLGRPYLSCECCQPGTTPTASARPSQMRGKRISMARRTSVKRFCACRSGDQPYLPLGGE